MVYVSLDLESRLLLIRNHQFVGDVPKLGKVFRITRVQLLRLSAESVKDIDIEVTFCLHISLRCKIYFLYSFY